MTAQTNDSGHVAGGKSEADSSVKQALEALLAEAKNVAHNAIHDAVYTIADCEPVKFAVSAALDDIDLSVFLPAGSPADSLKDDLVSELSKAEKIILVMLKQMTTSQKLCMAAELEAQGVSDDGATRYHERHAVLVKAGAA